MSHIPKFGDERKSPAGDAVSPAGDAVSPAGDAVSPAGGAVSPARDAVSPAEDVVASPDYGICEIAAVILMRVPRIQNFETRIWQQKIDYLNPIGL